MKNYQLPRDGSVVIIEDKVEEALPLIKLLSQKGTTVFVSTHTLNLAEELCDRIGVVYNGKLIACGTLDELRSKAEVEGDNLESLFLKLTGGPRTANLPNGITVE